MSNNKKNIVISIHGAGMHAGIWGGIVSSLDNISESISLPGHGGVDGELLTSIENMSKWVASKIDEHDKDTVILMGHSMGSLVSIELAGHSSVKALILLGSSALMPVNSDLLKLAKEDPSAAKEMILKYGLYRGHPQFEAIKEALSKQMLNVKEEALYNDLNACNNYLNGGKAAESLEKPALIISGEEDSLTMPSAGKELSNIISNSTFCIIKDSGHMLMFEQPVKVTEEINSFIKNL